MGFLKQQRGSEVIKKLYKDEFGNIITVKGGNSMLDNLVIRGVGLSASADAKQNTDELIKRWNAYDANQEEIADQKSLAAYAEQCANIAEKANDSLVLKNASLSSQVTRGVDDCNKLVIENNELKARTIVLKGVLDEFDRYMVDNMEYRQSAFAAKVHCALVNTKVQSLQSVKADAVKEFGHEIGLYNSEYDDQEYIEVSRYSLREHIEQLREGKS